MCVIIDRPNKHELRGQLIGVCANANPDGWGIMFADEGRVKTFRGMALGEFWQAYYGIESDREITIHFRIKTHGERNVENTHPFKVLSLEEDGEDIYVMHNGVIRINDTDNTKMSDTWHWVNKVLRPIIRRAPDILDEPVLQKMLEADLSGSKIVILRGNGQKIYLNKTLGTNDAESGCWFSNSNSLPRQAATTYNSQTYHGYGAYGGRDYETTWTRNGSTTTKKKGAQTGGAVVPFQQTAQQGSAQTTGAGKEKREAQVNSGATFLGVNRSRQADLDLVDFNAPGFKLTTEWLLNAPWDDVAEVVLLVDPKTDILRHYYRSIGMAMPNLQNWEDIANQLLKDAEADYRLSAFPRPADQCLA